MVVLYIKQKTIWVKTMSDLLRRHSFESGDLQTLLSIWFILKPRYYLCLGTLRLSALIRETARYITALFTRTHPFICSAELRFRWQAPAKDRSLINYDDINGWPRVSLQWNFTSTMILYIIHFGYLNNTEVLLRIKYM